jgi:hypothetical protein
MMYLVLLLSVFGLLEKNSNKGGIAEQTTSEAGYAPIAARNMYREQTKEWVGKHIQMPEFTIGGNTRMAQQENTENSSAKWGIELTESKLKLYPNPANSKVYVEGATTDVSIRIMNAIGMEMIATQEKTIDISQLAKGFYVYQIINDNNEILNHGKLVVE